MLPHSDHNDDDIDDYIDDDHDDDDDHQCTAHPATYCAAELAMMVSAQAGRYLHCHSDHDSDEDNGDVDDDLGDGEYRRWSKLEAPMNQSFGDADDDRSDVLNWDQVTGAGRQKPSVGGARSQLPGDFIYQEI